MLARPNRLTRGLDYRATVRRGRRVRGTATLAYVSEGLGAEPPRFGFIVPKTVGSAPVRNLVRRRLKAAAYENLSSVRPGTDIVFRALPAGARAGWTTLLEEVTRAVSEGSAR